VFIQNRLTFPLSILVFFVLCAFPVMAQDTETPTPTPTETPTPTPTPFTTNFTLIPTGAIMAYGYDDNLPDGWLLCDGSAVSRDDYSELFAIIGTLYGEGDGSTTFNLPDLRGRVVVGSGDGDDTSNRTIGEELGEETHTLTLAEMPTHDHILPRTNSLFPSGGSAADAGRGTANYNSSDRTSQNGFGEAHNIMQPSLVTAYIIWTGSITLTFGTGGDPMQGDTPTPGPTGTPTPNFYSEATVEVDGYGQAVRLHYEVTAGDMMVSILLFVVAALLILSLVLKVREQK
jgi:microcystin-dependent protein